MTTVRFTAYIIAFTMLIYFTTASGLEYWKAGLRQFEGQPRLRRIGRLSIKLQRMQSLIENGHLVEASGLAHEVTSLMSPLPDEPDIRLVFRFVNQLLTLHVPLIGGKRDTAELQSVLSIYDTLLREICLKDHLYDSETRLRHLLRLQDHIINTLIGIEQRVSRTYHRYHDKYRELQSITGKIDELYITLSDPVPCRWMRLMKDAATLQSIQPFRDGTVDGYYDRMIDRLYSKAMELFVQETRSLRRASKFDDAAYLRMFEKFNWIADQLPVPTVLEYCVSLSRKAQEDTDVGRFQHFTKIFYYDCLSGIRGLA